MDDLRWNVNDIVQAVADLASRELDTTIGGRGITPETLKTVRASIERAHPNGVPFWVCFDPSRPHGIYVCTIEGLRKHMAEATGIEDRHGNMNEAFIAARLKAKGWLVV